MKKLAFAFAILCAMPMMTSCFADNQNESDGQQEELVPADTIELQQVTGVAVDGAMNSVYLKVGDEVIEFSYPDLNTADRDAWDINDTLTIKYVETQNGDSVTQVINESVA